MFEIADGDMIKKKKIHDEFIHDILFHLGMKIGNSKAVKSAYENRGKNIIEL